MKNKTTALIFSILLDGLGIDRFYFGYTGIGILKLLTGGCFGALYIIDIVFIATGKLLPADGAPYEDDTGKKAAAADAYDDLDKLQKLHEKGAATDEEYEKLKTQCLNRM